VKAQQKVKTRSAFFLLTCLFLTSFLTFKTFKKVSYEHISIFGSELISIDDIVANSSINFSTPLIFVKTKYIEKELKRNLSLKNVSVYRQIFPFGLRVRIRTRTPVAYGERIFKGEKINGYIDEDGFFINEKYFGEENLKKSSSRIFGWQENFRSLLSKILKYQKNNDVAFVTIKFLPNGFLILEEKSLNQIILGLNSKKIETQLQRISDIKNQLRGRTILETIENIDLTDPNNPKIKVFKP